MGQMLSIGEFLNQATDQNFILLDVRSPGEYAQGHIPGAFSFPLFSDEERKQVGTLYKQESKEAAFLKGLDFVGPKMSGFVKEAKKLAGSKKIMLYCWRGGMRSQSMAWLLNSAGFQVVTIRGGYKAFRTEVLQGFNPEQDFLILGGFTGSRKSLILKQLKHCGEAIIDLESLAHHKGSAFGSIGEKDQPSQEQFENELFVQLLSCKKSKVVWLEDESKAIGKLRIPNDFFSKMRDSKLIFLKDQIERRLDYIVSEYGKADTEVLKASILKLKKRLGGLRMKEALEALEQEDIRKAASLILEYYDKAYQFGLSLRPAHLIREIEISEKGEEKLLEMLLEHSVK